MASAQSTTSAPIFFEVTTDVTRQTLLHSCGKRLRHTGKQSIQILHQLDSLETVCVLLKHHRHVRANVGAFRFRCVLFLGDVAVGFGA